MAKIAILPTAFSYQLQDHRNPTSTHALLRCACCATVCMLLLQCTNGAAARMLQARGWRLCAHQPTTPIPTIKFGPSYLAVQSPQRSLPSSARNGEILLVALGHNKHCWGTQTMRFGNWLCIAGGHYKWRW